MGNIFQCCQTLSNYFKCEDTPGPGEAERSPLLSSEESEYESQSLLDNSEDDAITVSTNSITNPALEPENFLFPDIILSSSLGGDVTLVEPMVCLLVSEDDEGGGEGMGEQRSEERGRSNEMEGRGYSEVETQTEIETQIGMGVQTQTESQAEVQTQTETFEFDDKTVVRGGSTIINSETRKEMDDWDQLEGVEQLLLEAQTSKKKSSDFWCDVEVSGDLELPGKAGRQTAKDKLEVTATLTKPNLQTEKNTDPMEEEHTDSAQRELTTLRCNKKPDEQKTESKHTSVMQADHKVGGTNENIAAAESEKMTKCSNDDTENVENFDLTEGCVDLKQQSNQDNGQMGELKQTANQKQHNKTNNHMGQTVGHIQSQDKTHLPKKLEEAIKTDEPQAEGEEEGETEIDQMTLFLVDRLFLAAPHVQTHPNLATAPAEDNLPEQSDDDKRKKLSIQDVVDLQETGFTVRIQPPGTESFELQVSGQMLVVELHQVIMDHEITCHRTCFSLQLGGVTLDSLKELHSIPGICDGAVIKVVEESYSVRDARLHLRHVRNLLRSLDPTDAYNGVNGSSLSYLTFYTRGNNDGQSSGKRRASERESVDCSPPEYILPGSRERPLCPLQPVREDWKCLRVLTLSSWNPPPGNRKMHGDLIYLNVLTMEDRELNITSSTRGFFLNQSTAFNFNPKPAVPKTLCHSLVELLSQVSPAFRKTFTALQKKRVQQHPYERIAAPFQVFTWTAPHGEHTLDCVRAEETHASYMGQDEHTSRDWNEELQGCRELPGSSLQERLHRERSIFKTNSDFVAAATRGAAAVIDGNIMPINPGESPHLQMFMWNNLFFSQGFDVSEHYRPLGGNTAAHAAAICDLRGAQAYASVDVEGLHTIGTAVVDYRGVRVIAQTIVPGILEKNQEESIVYGSNDNGKTVFTHSRFLELLGKTSKQLRIQRHQVLDHNNRPVELCSGIETIGILGNDRRPYILDLLRTFPPDLNFQFSETEERREEVPRECQSFGYPCLHCHSLASLRPEVIEAFIQDRYELFMKMVLHELSQLTEQDETTERSEKPVCDSDTGERDAASADMEIRRRNVILKACRAVGSVSDSCFDIRFNPDVCSPGARFPAECLEEVQRQRCLLWEAAAFLLSHQIPAVVKDCLDHTAVPMDGASLTSALHQRGVNVRYLGTILRELDRVEERGRLGHIQRICVSEIILRSAKHIFRTYLQDVEPAAFSAAVSHFLNCLLTSSSCFPDSCSDELLSRRRSRRRRSHGSRLALLSDSVWARLTSCELWGRIRAEARDYYHYTFDSESIDEVIEKHKLQRISLLREIAIKTGIQVQLREYVFESRHRPAFGEEDVVNMFPVVRHLRPTSSDATRLVQQAQLAVQQGLLKECYDLISQALTLFSSVCGVLHEDVCMCLRLLGRLSYILGENADALSHQEKAVMSSERVHGIDHPQTIQDYTFLTLYCFAGGRHLTSLQLLYRARYLTLLVSGDDHPQVALLDSMLGLVLHGLMEYELSLKFLQNAVTLTSKYHGVTSLKHAHGHHMLATVYESKGEFRSALHHEKEAYSIYKSQVGENHKNTKESSEYLKSLTQQAVILQKAINQIYSNTPTACIPPPKFPTPSLPTILQQLNLTCGIILIPLSGKEIDELRAEFKGKVKVKTEDLENQLLSSVENRQQY